MARAVVLAVSLIVAPTADVASSTTAPDKRMVQRYEPYRGWTQFGGRSSYAIPAVIVECESHGMLHEDSHPDSSSGLYQIELISWNDFGGRAFASFPFEATKLQQSIVATRIWREVGARAWTCAYITGWL